MYMCIYDMNGHVVLDVSRHTVHIIHTVHRKEGTNELSYLPYCKGTRWGNASCCLEPDGSPFMYACMYVIGTSSPNGGPEVERE